MGIKSVHEAASGNGGKDSRIQVVIILFELSMYCFFCMIELKNKSGCHLWFWSCRLIH